LEFYQHWYDIFIVWTSTISPCQYLNQTWLDLFFTVLWFPLLFVLKIRFGWWEIFRMCFLYFVETSPFVELFVFFYS
jgi:hypothetical protein